MARARLGSRGFPVEEIVLPRDPTPIYTLPLRGAGTPMVTSLSAYMQQLGHAYGVGPKYVEDLLAVAGFNQRLAWQRVSSTSGLGTRVAEVLSSATATPLAGSTLAPWSHLIDASPFVPYTRAWCPSCIAEWRSQGLPPTDALVWIVAPACPVHRTVLVLRCFSCKSRVAYRTTAAAGLCPSCGCDLGSGPAPRFASIAELYLTDQLTGWIAAGQSAAPPDSVTAWRALLEVAMEVRAVVAPRLFRAAWQWHSGHPIHIGHAIEHATSLGISLNAFATADFRDVVIGQGRTRSSDVESALQLADTLRLTVDSSDLFVTIRGMKRRSRFGGA